MPETKQKRLSDGDIFEHQGRTFRFKIVQDDESMGEPWKAHDGHGVISEWTRRAKNPGERVLCEDRDSKRYYDIQQTMKLAAADGWGCDEEKLAVELGHKPTKGEVTAAAVEWDFQRMKDWCEDRWTWVGVVVTLLKEDEDAPNGYFETKHRASLWGIESDCEDHLSEVGYELAEEIGGAK